MEKERRQVKIRTNGKIFTQSMNEFRPTARAGEL